MDLNRFFFGRPLSQDEITKKEMKAQTEAHIKAAQIIEADRIKREALYGKIKRYIVSKKIQTKNVEKVRK